MKIFRRKKDALSENRARIQKIVDSTRKVNSPPGWSKKTFAIGGFSECGFSKLYPELLLVVSSQGRGVIDCANLELIDRDNDVSFDWFNSYELWAMGIGKIANEKISMAGIVGGGLPRQNKSGDVISLLAPEWPVEDLIFQPKLKSVFKQGEEKECFRIFHDYQVQAYGFSSLGNYFVVATSSEIDVYRKEEPI